MIIAIVESCKMPIKSSFSASSLRNALQQVMEISKDGFILFDSTGEIQYINSAAKVLTGYNTDHLKEQISIIVNDDSLKQLEISGSGDTNLIIEELSASVEWNNGPVRLAIMIKNKDTPGAKNLFLHIKLAGSQFTTL